MNVLPLFCARGEQRKRGFAVKFTRFLAGGKFLYEICLFASDLTDLFSKPRRSFQANLILPCKNTL